MSTEEDKKPTEVKKYQDSMKKKEESSETEDFDGIRMKTTFDEICEDYWPYRPDNELSIAKYLKYLEKNKDKIFKCKTREKCMEAVKNHTILWLSMIVRKVTMSKVIYIAKESDNNPFSRDFQIVAGWVKGTKAGAITIQYQENKKWITSCVGPFSVLIDNCLLLSEKFICVPYHFDDPPRNTMDLNLFRGFKAVYQEHLTYEKAKKRCQPILDHIFNVLASKDKDLYNCILEIICYPMRTLKRSKIMLTLIGKQGVGKTIVLDFLQEWVYGRSLCSQITGLDSITGKFNAFLESKMLVCINETANAGSAKGANLKQAEILKHSITDKTLFIEPKGRDSYEIDNLANYILTTNSPQPLILTEDNRRDVVIECSNKKESKEYFTELCDSFNTKMGNAFYTMARLSKSFWDLSKIPDTQARRDCIEGSRIKAMHFFDDLLENSIIPIDKEYIVVHENQVYVKIEDIYALYLHWHKSTNDGQLWSSDKLSKTIKKQEGIEHIPRKRIGGRPQKAYIIIKDSLLDKVCYRDSKLSDSTYPLRDLLSKEDEEDEETKLQEELNAITIKLAAIKKKKVKINIKPHVE